MPWLKSLLLTPFAPGPAAVRIRYRNAEAECELILGEAGAGPSGRCLLEALAAGSSRKTWRSFMP